MKPTNKHRYLAVAALAAALAGTYGWTHRAQTATPGPTAATAQESAKAGAVAVSTLIAASTTVPQTLALSARIVAQDALRVGTELPAVKVAQVMVDVGHQVTRGQVLARLDTRLLASAEYGARATLRVATQQLASARAQAEEARAALARAEQAQGALSKEVLAQRRTADQTAAAALAMAEAQLESATANAADAGTRVGYAAIVSPVDGIVSARNVAAGEVVSSANNPLFVVDSNVRELEVDLSAAQKELLPTLSKAAIVGKDTPLSLRWVSPEIYASGNTARARFRIEDKSSWTPGTRVNVLLTLAEKEAVRIPLRALQKGENGWQVYVVANGRIATRAVTVQEPVSGSTVALESGVKAGEHVVADGLDFLADGMAVTEIGSGK